MYAMEKLNEFESVLGNFTKSLEKFELDKINIAKGHDVYLIEFKNILFHISRMNLFFYQNSSKEFRNYIDYFNNMIFAKLKHFFFKENPLRPENELLFSNDNISDYIIKLYTTSDNKTKKAIIVRYFLFLFLKFDFLYSKGEKVGRFTSFDVDYDKFNKCSSFLKEKLNKIQNSKSSKIEYLFKEFAIDLISTIVGKAINSDGGIDNIFKKYIETSNISFEPFSYCIAYILWQDAHLVQDVSDEQNIDDAIRKYIQNIIELINLFSKLYTQKNAIDIYNKIFDKQLDIIDKITQMRSGFEMPVKWSDEYSFYEIDSNSLEKYQIKNIKFKDFSIEALLQQKDNKALNSLLYRMYNSKVLQDKDKISLFASYSSGLFLSVLFKLLYQEKDIDIFIFGLFPNSDIYPYYVKTTNSIFTNIKDIKEAIVLDDLSRTGFTLSLIIDRYKIFTNNNISYKNIVFKRNVLLENKFIEEIDKDNLVSFDVKFRDKIEEIDIDFNNNFDFSSLFLSREYMSYIIDKMMEYLKDMDDISFFYGSDGKTLSLLVGYFLKEKYNKKISFNRREKENKVFIDMAYSSGFTYDRIKKLKNIEKFQKIIVVKNFSEDKSICSVF